MLSRYSFGFEEKEGISYYGNNPSVSGYYDSGAPSYVVYNGHLWLGDGGVNQVGRWSYLWSNYPDAENHSSYYYAGSVAMIYPAALSYRFQGFSLRS